MTDNMKVISRPKVRFCQFSDNVRNKTEIVENCKQSALRASGPKIKEIVTLEKPVKVVDSTKFASVCDEDTSSSNRNVDTLSHDIASGDIRKMFLFNKNMPKVESTMILRDVNGIQNRTKNSSKILQRVYNKSPQDDVLKDNTKNVQQKGKENKDKLSKRSTYNKNVSDTTTGNFQHIQSVTPEKFQPSIDNNRIPNVNIRDFERSKVTKSQSASSVMNKTRDLTIEGRILGAKPILSRYKIMTRNKMSPVKKMVLHNISGSKIKTSVEPGVFLKKQTDAKTSDANERRIVASDVTAVEDLAQPEYNSITCTINKLKELEQQKVVADINHLPFALKSFLSGKISAALDFSLNETIYKNLIDLSIDEKQLPSTIIRSKDPEPRQKDIVPQLSDFFIPEDIKEICEAVHVKFRASQIDDNWNAFKISDRILEWKYSIDDID